MTQKENLEKMERGQEAALMEATIGPYINNRISGIVQRMVASYRSERTEHDRLVGYAAQIAGLFDLISDLENAQRQGHVAAQKEMGNGKEEES